MRGMRWVEEQAGKGKGDVSVQARTTVTSLTKRFMSMPKSPGCILENELGAGGSASVL